ncbi:MAG: flagellin [Selenomonadaceae bacterium]|nr:flagellin [Selenomonadaceae bacterium]
MASVINTNIAATRTHNVYNRNNEFMNAAMTRVATGMKINSAKDGASTWAISEKMRERIRANDQANQNVQNDTALIKTAQGGVGNTIDILKTLKERAINAANDSNMNVDRTIIAEEVRQLVNQIDDNAAKVKFNGRTLLQGSVGDDTAATALTSATDPAPVTSAAAGGVSTPATVEPTHGYASITSIDGFYKSNGSGGSTAADKDTTLQYVTKNDGTTRMFATGDKITVKWSEGNSTTADKSATYTVADSDKLSEISATGNGAVFKWFNQNDPLTNGTDAVKDSDGNAVQASADGFYLIGGSGKHIDNISISVASSTGVTNTDATTAFGSFGTVANNPTAPVGGSGSDELTFYVGGEANFGINVKFANMTSSGSVLNLGSDVETFANLFLDKSDAQTALGKINNALDNALKEQAKLGAIENRLGYTADNITTMNENLEAADSVMRDSDIAKEMTSYMKYAVLSQASQYMLAQAGQNAFQVLNLLQQ